MLHLANNHARIMSSQDRCKVGQRKRNIQFQVPAGKRSNYSWKWNSHARLFTKLNLKRNLLRTIGVIFYTLLWPSLKKNVTNRVSTGALSDGNRDYGVPTGALCDGKPWLMECQRGPVWWKSVSKRSANRGPLWWKTMTNEVSTGALSDGKLWLNEVPTGALSDGNRDNGVPTGALSDGKSWLREC